jgi:glyoxylase-like metal-dependent hydrolase (beta-lactamase superfamily II)
MMNENAYPFRVGDLDCIAVRDCSEPGAVKELIPDIDDPAVTQAFARRGWPTGDISYDFLALFVRSGQHRIVIDAGWGSCSDQHESRFLQTLGEAGVMPEDVTQVILTHLDLDHAGGVLDGRGGLAFPNARHVMAEETLTGYTSDRIQAMLTPPDAAAYREMAALLSGRTLLTQGETEVLPGVRVLPAPGHRLGHVAVELVSDGHTLLHLADTVLHPAVIEHPDWRTGYDSVQETIRATRHRLFGRAAASNALVFFSHTPFPGLCYIRREGTGWRWEPLADPRANQDKGGA